MTLELGVIGILGALVLGLVIALWRQSRVNGELRADVKMLRATAGAQAGATAAMSTLPDPESGSVEILAEALARAARAEQESRR